MRVRTPFQILEDLAIPTKPRLSVLSILTVSFFGAAVLDFVPWKDLVRHAGADAGVELRGASLSNNRVAPGEPLWIELDLVQNMACEGQVDRSFSVDSGFGSPVVLHQQPLSFRSMPGTKKRTVGVTVPTAFSPGKYYYRAHAYLRCEDGRTYDVDSKALPFEIAAAK